jgi:predicted ATPase/DNA-binding winged helix-turn-helix (wHTH) protein
MHAQTTVEPNPARSVYTSGECEIDLARRELRARGATVPIGARAFEIIEVLVLSAGQLVTKNDLMDRVWSGAIVEDNTLQVHVSAVRKALGAHRAMLKTESGRGYRLLGNWSSRTESISPRFSPQRARSSVEVPTTNFPATIARLVGRSAAASRLQDLLSAYRVVTLTGPGGIGKTTLALEVARNLRANFVGGGWLVELASLSDSALVPTAVAAVLGLNISGERISSEVIARGIGERNLLLLLDNCEHVIDEVAELAEAILRLCPRTTVLATSREMLRIDGEYVYRVQPLDVPAPGEEEPDHLIGRSAVELFVARTRALDAEFSPERETLTSIAEICRHLDGIPLAIEFAAARAATLGVGQVATGLEDRFNLLSSGRRTALPRHQTLRATLDWSYDLLPEDEQQVLRRVAIFPAGFSLEAAIAVAGDPPAARVINDVANLVTKSLIVAQSLAEAPLYRLLETTRLYALEKLRGAHEDQPTARRHAEYYRDFFGPAEAESETRPQAEWLAIYGRHIDNVRAALDWTFSREGDPTIGIALTVAAVPLWVELSLMSECHERVERALASLGSGAENARARMQLSAALGWSLLYGVGRARETGGVWATTLELAEQLDDGPYRLRALWGLCIDQFNNGEFRTALDYARRFAALVEGSSDQVDGMMGDRALATALHYFGDQNGARRHIDRVLVQQAALAQQPSIVRFRFDQRVTAHYFQARILWLQGFADQARRVVEVNIEEGHALGHALALCSVLGQGACPILFLCGDLDAAAFYGAMLLDHTDRHRVRLWHLWARCFEGMVTIKRSDITTGLNQLRGALDDAGDARFLPRFLLPLGEMATCLGETGEIAAGLNTVETALARCRTRDEGWYLPELLRIKGELLRRQAEDRLSAAAEEHFGEAMRLAAEQGAMSWELRAALSLARLWVKQDRRAAARHILAPVYDKFTEGFDTADLLAAKQLLDGIAAGGPA